VTDAARTRRRAFGALLALGILNHVALTGARVDVSLDALAAALLRDGRIADRALRDAADGLRRRDRPLFRSRRAGTPMLAGRPVSPRRSRCCARAGFPGALASAALAGLSFTMFQVALQHVTGEMGDPGKRVKRFSLLRAGVLGVGIVGPLFTGFAIDYAGHRAAFALLAVVPLAPLAVLLSRRIALPAPAAHEEHASGRGMFDLVRHRPMRRLLALNGLVRSWLGPAHGVRADRRRRAGPVGEPDRRGARGLRSRDVRGARGLAVGRFARERDAGARRRALPVGRRVRGIPFATGAGMLAMLSFTLGLGLGGGQPVMMSLLTTRAPPGRMGEVAGLRMSMIQTMAVAAPLAFGALGTTLGLLPVFWGVGAC